MSSPEPRGVKRSADDAFSAPRRIKALHQDVVSKIAAGEIIVAPVHALKELIENAVDAGSTSLEILAKDGGLKLLQITDNGTGINKEDLPILCERFTTSKLKTFEDLTSIGTYGFRGEALASISHIAHLTITTKTHDSNCAWRAQYAGGKLAPAKPGQSADPKPCAGKQGTQIAVEDLFYNVPTRRKAFRSSSEEYARILDMVGRYSVHCSGVAFSCRKQGDAGAGLSVPSIAATVDRLRIVYGSTIANDVIPIDLANDTLGFKCRGLVTSANHFSKKTTLLLFINHRSVESSAIKKAVEQTYQPFLPKGGHPFVYLDLEIDPARVDVNVHPTKREVNFLNEEEIITCICDEIRTRLGKVDTSRTFMTQSLLSTKRPTQALNQSPDEVPMPTLSHSDSAEGNTRRTPASKVASHKPYENNLVRVDSRVRKITSMLPPGQTPASTTMNNSAGGHEMEYEYQDGEPTTCNLLSVKELRAEVRDNMHNELTIVFHQHIFCGVVDEQRRIAAIQGGVKLYLVDYGMVSREFFYQLGLTDFGNFGSIRFDEPLDLRELLQLAAQQEAMTTANPGDDLDWEEVVDMVHTQLIDRQDMLSEYFNLQISEDGMLESIPLLIKGYLPSMAKLPNFLLRLGPHVEWSNEKECFESFLRELASFYVPESLSIPQPEVVEDDLVRKRREHLSRAVEHVLFPAFKARLVATKDLRGSVIEVADLKGLYRVFERC